jgi:hypothetical protein
LVEFAPPLSGDRFETRYVLRNDTAVSTLKVVNEYQWAFDPRRGQIHVYVDGKHRAAMVNDETYSQSFDPKTSHNVRVRLWWYMSPRVTVAPSSQETVTLYAGRRTDLSVARAMLLMCFRPLHSLKLSLFPTEEVE